MFDYKVDALTKDLIQYIIQGDVIKGPKLLFELNEDAKNWLEINCPKKYHIEKVSSSSGIYKLDILFENEEDSVNFKLTWL